MSSILSIKQTTTEYFTAKGRLGESFTLAHNPIYIKECKTDNHKITCTYNKNSKEVTSDNIVLAPGSIVTITYVYYSELPMIRGRQGKSAYQAARENGYNKTEAEFNATLGKMDSYDVIVYNAVPTETTIGVVGQKYVVNKENLYICLGESEGKYIWKQIV